jgi:hypothetical protein
MLSDTEIMKGDGLRHIIGVMIPTDLGEADKCVD